jgi:hypothetical protein
MIVKPLQREGEPKTDEEPDDASQDHSGGRASGRLETCRLNLFSDSLLHDQESAAGARGSTELFSLVRQGTEAGQLRIQL